MVCSPWESGSFDYEVSMRVLISQWAEVDLQFATVESIGKSGRCLIGKRNKPSRHLPRKWFPYSRHCWVRLGKGADHLVSYISCARSPCDWRLSWSMFLPKRKTMVSLLLKVNCHAIQWFNVDFFLRSKMAARRLEAAAPANKKQAFAFTFFLRRFRASRSINVGVSVSYPCKVILSRTKTGFEIRSRKWKQKDKLSMKNGEYSWKTKQACGSPRIDLELSWHSWSEDRSRLARLSQVSGAVAYISLRSTIYATIFDRQDTCWARFAWKDARPPLFFPHNKMAQKITE